MEKYVASGHVAVVENCVMTTVGLCEILSCCAGASYRLQTFKDSCEWFSQREHRRYDIVIYSVSGARCSRQQSIHFLSHLNCMQPDAARILLAENEGQAKLIHYLLPVPVHAVLCKTSSVEKLALQLRTVMKQREFLDKPYQTLNCSSGYVSLSLTERTILHYIRNGFSISEIAVQMARNPKTIRTHKFNTMSKLGVRSDCGLLCAADILCNLPLQSGNACW
ncbi:MAG TPA: LuxR C-terminal-related transcriptional regulator [Scandinavium sp.]|jgi:DNA-binding NarL/FixJ family response regulator|uniref:LuxR C-terminal-related transcriptional regulator n=1 Tax=Scandinavium sp. TaxID=2830653 RepID=UPI002E341BEF|nr:LuxR C-terminal-related transcriptional regulator [Scandinavium sp.]HEX4499626.1 LuxR C-terminal-related transcriptional regulator [Scandinavium sp.]